MSVMQLLNSYSHSQVLSSQNTRQVFTYQVSSTRKHLAKTNSILQKLDYGTYSVGDLKIYLRRFDTLLKIFKKFLKLTSSESKFFVRLKNAIKKWGHRCQKKV